MPVLKRLTSIAVVCVSAAACSDSVGPEDVNPALLASSVSGATATFNNNAAFQSLATLSVRFPQYAAVAALRATLPAIPAYRLPAALAGARARGDAVRLVASLHADPLALFPSNVLGKTLEWDVVNSVYVVGAAAGAPGNGIRILLYAVNPVTGQPTVPLQQLGYVELTDESTAAADQLGILLTLGTTPIADYAIRLTAGTTINSLEAVGFIRNAQGSGQVDFDFTDVTNSAANTYVSTSELNAEGGTSVFVEIGVTVSTVSLSIAVSQKGNRIEMDLTVDDQTGAIIGTVKYNGTPVANVSGDVNAPVFTAVTGRTLSAVETASLIAIFASAVEVATDLGGAVYSPGGVVFSGR